MLRSLLLLCFLAGCAAQQMISCTTQTGPCSCTTADGDIDLTPLAKKGGDAKFADVQDTQGNDAFSYNPCEDFSEGGDACKDVAVCQVQGTLPPAYFNLGNQDSAKFTMDQDRGLEIQYFADTVENTLRTAYVQLICDNNEEGKLEADGELDPGSAEYYLKLTSKHCCPKGGPPPGKSTTIPPIGPTGGNGGNSGGFSKGGIVLIVFFSVLIVYFISGFVFMKVVRKARGRESIPNAGFWVSLPALIKDGTMFIVRRGRTRGYNDL